jgi:hypothetical protein
MTLYILKPPIYDAIQWDGTNDQTIIDFVGTNSNAESRFRSPIDETPGLLWNDDQGGYWQTCTVNDWITMVPGGSYQNYDPVFFDATFELAE